MEYAEEHRKYFEIFNPGYIENILDVSQNNRRFAYYTSADTALKIIRNQELWLRSATVMNDFSEISYGLSLITSAFSGPTKDSFQRTVDSIFPETFQKVDARLSDWVNDWKLETYIACVSMHSSAEDRMGRLSMWRAYGNTALIIHNTPMMADTDLLAVYSMPVAYLSHVQYAERLNGIIENIDRNKEYLEQLGQDVLISYLQHMFFTTAIGSKHPGFAEEKEWRIFYRPNERKSDVLEPRVVVLDGIPQTIYALPLLNDPTRGLHGADIPQLLDHLIIGPTQFPYVSVRAFKSALDEANVKDFEEKVFASDIPLRT